MITIRRAVYEDISRIMRFIDVHYKKGHILGNNRDFFEWMYVKDNDVNFYFAEDVETNEILAIEGFILYNSLDRPDMTGSMWRAIKCENPMIGVEVSLRMEEEINAVNCYGSGFSKRAQKIHKLWGHEVINMNHYYRLNRLENYKIAIIDEVNIPPVKDYGYQLIELKSITELKEVLSIECLKKRIFYKDYEYLDRRYFQHPIWKYIIWKIVKCDGSSESVLIGREQEYDDSRILKIIDFLGNADDFKYIGYTLDMYMKQRECEYVDVYFYGIPCSNLEEGGFVKRKENDSNIIPNLFYPFVPKNVEIAMMKPSVNLIMMRGDGDQDRPN